MFYFNYYRIKIYNAENILRESVSAVWNAMQPKHIKWKEERGASAHQSNPIQSNIIWKTEYNNSKSRFCVHKRYIQRCFSCHSLLTVRIDAIVLKSANSLHSLHCTAFCMLLESTQQQITLHINRLYYFSAHTYIHQTNGNSPSLLRIAYYHDCIHIRIFGI